MASLDSLPPDQRAVLQMVLGRGRGYDDIASMLSIDRAGVRDRALAALDALGPSTSVSPERRHLIVDYLLGQLPPRVAEDTRKRLGEEPSERAWARVVASELAPLASGPMPEIPTEAVREPAPPEPEPEPEPPAPPPERAPAPKRERAPAPAAPEADAEPARIAADYGLREPAGPRGPRVSRLGGAILLAVGAAVVVAVVVIFVVNGGSSHKHHASTVAAGTTPTSTSTSPSTTAKPVAQINLVSPTGSRTTAGIAEVLRQGSKTAVAIVGQGLPANTKHNAYAVWLYNSPASAVRLGFVNPGVGSNGRLETAGALPANAGGYKQLLVTLETTANPRSPGKIVLEGNLTGV
jgi:hypothetical protein